MYLLVLSENHKGRFARELLYPSATLTPSPFGARLTPLNLALLDKNHTTEPSSREINPLNTFKPACRLWNYISSEKF